MAHFDEDKHTRDNGGRFAPQDASREDAGQLLGEEEQPLMEVPFDELREGMTLVQDGRHDEVTAVHRGYEDAWVGLRDSEPVVLPAGVPVTVVDAPLPPKEMPVSEVMPGDSMAVDGEDFGTVLSTGISNGQTWVGTDENGTHTFPSGTVATVHPGRAIDRLRAEFAANRLTPDEYFRGVADQHHMLVYSRVTKGDEGYDKSVDTNIWSKDGNVFVSSRHPAQISSDLELLHENVDHGRFATDEAFAKHYRSHGGSSSTDFTEARRFEEFVGPQVAFNFDRKNHRQER